MRNNSTALGQKNLTKQNLMLAPAAHILKLE